MNPVPKPTKQKKKKIKKPKSEPWICNNCIRENKKKFPTTTLADKRAILDHLWGDAVFKRDKGTCQKCGRKDTLAGHHIFGKKAYPSGRWNLDNGILLCYGHHIHFAHKSPYLFEDWMKKNQNGFGSGMWDWLHSLVIQPSQFRARDFEEIKARLEKELQ